MATEPCPGDNAKYTITLNAAQARAVLSSLELYFRLGMGQVDELNPFWGWRATADPDKVRWALLLQFAVADGMGYGDYLAVDSAQLPEQFKVACDIFQVLRREVAREEQHHAASVWHHTPLRNSKQPLPKVSTENQP